MITIILELLTSIARWYFSIPDFTYLVFEEASGSKNYGLVLQLEYSVIWYFQDISGSEIFCLKYGIFWYFACRV
jgi:hypothetical protein